jgi:hypothetical protein
MENRMSDEPPHLTLIDGTLGQEADDISPGPPVTAPITPPRNYENWKRKSFSEGLMEAYHRLGGIDYLVQFGRDHPADFVRACSRMIPREIRADLVGEVTIIHAIPPTVLDVFPEEDGRRRSRVRYIEQETKLEKDEG